MRRIICLLIISVLFVSLISCEKNSNISGSVDDNTLTETDESVNPKAGMGGTSGMCGKHVYMYHSFPLECIEDRVEREEFDQWFENDIHAKDGCPYYSHSLYSFIRKFDIPRGVFFEKVYVKYYERFIVDLDLLYGDDQDKCDEFFTKENQEKYKDILEQRNDISAYKSYIWFKLKPEKRGDIDNYKKDIDYDYVWFASYCRIYELKYDDICDLIDVAYDETLNDTSYFYDHTLEDLENRTIKMKEFFKGVFDENGNVKERTEEIQNDPYPELLEDSLWLRGTTDYYFG